MSQKEWTVFLSGEVHSDWRDKIIGAVKDDGLPVRFFGPVTDHTASDNCGTDILGAEDKKFWKDHKGAKLNTIRNRTLIAESDIVVVRFGDKYKQWNAAFDAGYAVALGKSLIVQHHPDDTHAMKEIDAVALAVAETPEQVVAVLKYVVA